MSAGHITMTALLTSAIVLRTGGFRRSDALYAGVGARPDILGNRDERREVEVDGRSRRRDVRLDLAVQAGRGASWLSPKLGRGGGSMIGGRVTLALDHGALAKLAADL